MADSIKVICDNLGGPIRVAMGTPLSDVAAQLTPGRYPFLAAFVNNRIKELNYKIYTPVTVRFVDITDFAGIRVYQRTSWFILQKAARTLFPGHTLHIRHSMGQSGFYCELEGLDEFTHEQAAALEGHMREVVAQNLPIERTKVLTSELRAIYAEQGFDDKTALLDTCTRWTARPATSTGRWPPRRATSTASASNPTTRASIWPCPCGRTPACSTRTSSRRRCSAFFRSTSHGSGSWASPPWATSIRRCSRATPAA